MRKLAIVLFLFSLLAVSCTTGVSQEEYDKVSSDLTRAQQEVETTQLALTNTLAELRAAEEELRGTREERDAVQRQLAEGESEATRLQEELDLYRETGIIVKSGVEPYYLKDPGAPVRLSNNPTATNPTWAHLKAFLLRDTTDERMYIDGLYTCGNFAEDVHNNAEASGIKSALVIVHFEEKGDPHALNAFKTVDKGLVFIDCTGGATILIPPPCMVNVLTGQKSCPEPPDPSHDGVAYVEVGNEYGQIDLHVVAGFSYNNYEKHMEQWDAYEIAIEEYNAAVYAYNADVYAYNADGDAYDALFYRCGGYATPGECQRLLQWYDDLEQRRIALNSRLVELDEQEAESDSQLAELGSRWETQGIVSSVEIYW